MSIKPLIFIDLDDTLFQTQRRAPPNAHARIASLDQHGQALAYMQPKQQLFSDWLFASAEVIPVTARSIDALARVKLPFQSAAICSHGGSIIDAQQQIDSEWLEIQQQQLKSLQLHMKDLIAQIQQYAAEFGSVRTWVVEEYGLKIYAVAKQNQHDRPLFLTKIIKKLPIALHEQFYMHLNGNNLAIIPKAISKQNAVSFYLNKHEHLQQRVILGFGDSLSDFGFLSCCDWFGMPKHSQLHRLTEIAVVRDAQLKGYFGHV